MKKIYSCLLLLAFLFSVQPLVAQEDEEDEDKTEVKKKKKKKKKMEDDEDRVILNKQFKTRDTAVKYHELVLRTATEGWYETNFVGDKFVHITYDRLFYQNKYKFKLTVLDRDLKEVYTKDLAQRKETEHLYAVLSDDKKLYFIYADDKKLKGKENRRKKLFRICVVDIDSESENDIELKCETAVRPKEFFVKADKLWFRGYYVNVVKKRFLREDKTEDLDMLGYVNTETGDLVTYHETDVSSVIRFIANTDSTDEDVLILKTQQVSYGRKKAKKVRNVNPEFYKVSTEDDKIELRDKLEFDEFTEGASVTDVNYNALNETERIFYGIYLDKWEKFMDAQKAAEAEGKKKKKEKKIKIPVNFYFRTYDTDILGVDTAIAFHNIKDYAAICKKVKKMTKLEINQLLAKERLDFSVYDVIQKGDTFLFTIAIVLYEAKEKSIDNTDISYFKYIRRNVGLVMLCMSKDGKLIWEKFLEHKGKPKTEKDEKLYRQSFVDAKPCFIFANEKNTITLMGLTDNLDVSNRQVQLGYKPRKESKKGWMDGYTYESEMRLVDTNKFICVGHFRIDKKIVEDMDNGNYDPKYKSKMDMEPKMSVKSFYKTYTVVYTVLETATLNEPPPPAPVVAAPVPDKKAKPAAAKPGTKPAPKPAPKSK